MTSDLYAPQYKNETLLDAMNILAVEPYGNYKLLAFLTPTWIS
jgi:hypothetical protein